MIVMLEHGLTYYPNSVAVHTWLIKLYTKLAMVSLVKNLTERFPTVRKKEDKPPAQKPTKKESSTAMGINKGKM